VAIVGLVAGFYSRTSFLASVDSFIIGGPSSGYLTYYYDQQETEIFLLSTENPRYGSYKWNNTNWDFYEGDPCFIVNVTIRNDYTKNQLWSDEDSPLGLYNNHVKLTAILYNHQGKIEAVDVTHPINSLHGGHVFRVEPEETHSVELYIATESKDIERFEIYVTYIGPAMEP
jgi:hypothetical protein